MSSKCKDFLNLHVPSFSLQDRFEFYICAKIAILVSSMSTYSSFYDALMSYSARPFLAYLPQLQFAPAVFNEFTAIVKDMGSYDFLDTVVPGLIACDAKTLFSKLESGHSVITPRHHIYALLRIMGCLLYRQYVDQYSYPAVVYRIPYDRLKDNLYLGYPFWPFHQQYDNIRFPIPFRDNLFDLWKTMYGLPYDTSLAAKTTGVSGIVNDLHAVGLNDDDILDLFSTAKLHKKLETSDPDNPIAYLKKVVLGQRIALSDNSVISPAERFLLSDELLKQCVARWRNTDTVDFIRSLLYSKASASITTENAIMLHRINEAVSYGVSKL